MPRPVPYVPYRSSRYRPPRVGWWWLVPVAVVLACFFLCFSAVPIPMWNPTADLNGRLAVVGMSLPATATVPHGAQDYRMDPTQLYKVEVPPADLPGFVAKLNAAGFEPAERDLGVRAARPPDWWRPTGLPNARMLYFHESGSAWWQWYYSDTSGTIYVVRQEY